MGVRRKTGGPPDSEPAPCPSPTPSGDRLLAIATAGKIAAEALDGLEVLDLDAERQARLPATLNRPALLGEARCHEPSRLNAGN
jgi:hypothetical protein